MKNDCAIISHLELSLSERLVTEKGLISPWSVLPNKMQMHIPISKYYCGIVEKAHSYDVVALKLKHSKNEIIWLIADGTNDKTLT